MLGMIDRETSSWKAPDFSFDGARMAAVSFEIVFFSMPPILIAYADPAVRVTRIPATITKLKMRHAPSVIRDYPPSISMTREKIKGKVLFPHQHNNSPPSLAPK
jgi:hypothetical protein